MKKKIKSETVKIGIDYKIQVEDIVNGMVKKRILFNGEKATLRAWVEQAIWEKLSKS